MSKPDPTLAGGSSSSSYHQPLIETVSVKQSTMAIKSPPSTLFASIDMGSNSFKLLIVQAEPCGKFFIIDRFKDSVLLGQDSTRLISKRSHRRSLKCLHKFKKVLDSHNVGLEQIRCVATAAVREAENKSDFSRFVMENVGLKVNVLSGEEEARLVYLGVLQFLPLYDKLVLAIDIGGGSTEFVIGKQGNVVFGSSLNLGHVTLTHKFASTGTGEIENMREYIRLSIKESGLVEKVKDCGFDVVVGSSGTIKSIEKGICYGYGKDVKVQDQDPMVKECKRQWRFNRSELKNLVERVCNDAGEGGRIKRDEFFKKRSKFIVAGAVLLEEIFQIVGIEEKEVSGYALGEGVIAETLCQVYDEYDLNANASWRSVNSTRLTGKHN